MARNAHRILLPLAIALAAGAQLASVLLQDPGIHGYEELYNAAHAAMIQQGGLGLVFPLQYRPFCGGCSVVALMGAGAFSLLGPSILAWRTLGFGFYLLALGSGVALARRAAGPVAAVAVALLFACAPPAYQELAQICHGNHPEGGALLLAQLALAGLALSMAPGLRRELVGLAVAVFVGFGFFFLRSLVLGLVPLGLVALGDLCTPASSVRRLALRVPLLAAGLALGLAPVLGVHQATGTWPVGFMYLPEEAAPSIAWTGHNLLSLLHPAQLRGIWGDVAAPSRSWLGVPAFGAWIALVALLGAGLRGLPAAPARRLAAALPAVLAMFLLIYAVFRLSVGVDLVNSPTPWQVRYLAVVQPAALVAAGLGFGIAWRRWARVPVRAGLVVLLALLCLPGAFARARIWRAGDPALPWRRYAPDWCYQPECLQGDMEVLYDASLGSRFAEVALAGGLHAAGDPFALAASAQVPATCGELGAWDDPAVPHSWAWGEALGAIVPARDLAQGGGTFPSFVAELSRRLPDGACSPREPALHRVLWRALWCHARPQLQDAASVELVDEGADSLLPELTALGRGVGAARLCLAEDAGEAVVTWDPTCQVWLRSADPEPLGWGLGVALAEARAGSLTRIELDLDPTLTPEESARLMRAFDAGWRWGSSWHWLPPRLPPVKIALRPEAD
ncbi:MAG: hypothetical protein ABIO70_06815 [Pseudomonadota bacterium]